MKALRLLLVLCLSLCLPAQAMAGMATTRCLHAQSAAAPGVAAATAHHDHAAMIAKAAEMQHAPAEATNSAMPQTPSPLACQCGCKCAGACAMGCAAASALPALLGFVAQFGAAPHVIAEARGHAHAAYRFKLLRPPSVVAL